MSVKDLYPNLRPSLALNFAQTKTLDPRITFSRASTGTYYDGVTHAKAEENLFTYSQEFDQSPWISSNATVTANDTTAPDGTNTADKFAENGSEPYVRQSFSLTSNTLYVFSVFAKADTSNYVYLTFYRSGSNNAFAEFDLSSGTLNRSGDTGVVTLSSSNVTSIGSGWYRIEIICSSTSGGGNPLVWAGLSDGVTAVNSEGRYPIASPSGESVYLWGAQLEQRSSVTAYTATTDQPITNYIPVLQSAAAGEARFDHDPVTGESKGLLIEEQRTNLALRSEEFNSGTWVNEWSNPVEIDSRIAPDGTLTMDAVTSSSGSLGITQTVNTGQNIAGKSFTVSCWYYADEELTFKIRLRGTGSVTEAENFPITVPAKTLVRLHATKTFATADGTSILVVPVYNLNSGGKVWLWGAQLEAGAFPTSYIKTTSAQATRSADSASMTGTNFSEWFRQDAGSFFIDALASNPDTRMLLEASKSDSTITDRLALYKNSLGKGSFLVAYNSSNQVVANSSSNFVSSIAAAYKANDFAQSTDGATAVTDSSGVLPTLNVLRIGQSSNASDKQIINGTIKRLTYYPARLTNAQLQALTEG